MLFANACQADVNADVNVKELSMVSIHTRPEGRVILKYLQIRKAKSQKRGAQA